MKWHAQVLHVASKDLRLSRWLLVAYAAVVAAVTAGVAEWSVFAAVDPLLRMFGVFMLGAVLLAVLVQADSPARGDSLWVTLPLQPSAVFAAKLVVGMVVLIGIPLIGQLVGLQAHDVAPGDLPGLLGQSAVSYGLWLAIVAAVAALTRDLRSFLLVLTLVTLGWQFAGRILYTMGPSGPSGWNTSPFIVAGMLLLLAHQYRTREVRRGAVIAVALGIAVLFLPLALPRSAASAVPATRAIPGHLQPASIEIGNVALQPGARAGFALRLNGASRFHHYLLVSPTVRIRMGDGSSAVVPVREPLVSFGEPIARLNGVRSLGRLLPMAWLTAGVSVDLSPAQRRALAAGEARLSLQGDLEVQELRAGAELPLRVGASAADGGSRIRITSVESLPEGPAVEVRTSRVSLSRGEGLDATMYEPRVPEYLLVNRGRREAVELRSAGSSGSGIALVLPGPRAESSTIELLPQLQHPGDTLRIEPAWLEGARLLRVTWVPLGSVPVLAEDRGRGYEEWTAEISPRGRGR